MSAPEPLSTATGEPGVSRRCTGLFRAWDFYLLRAPAGSGTGGLDPLCSPDQGAPDQDVQAYLELLELALADEHLVEAIRLASPSLHGVLRRVAAGEARSLKRSQLRRAAFAVLRYDIRLRSRPTPFGLFAGVSCGDFTDHPDPASLPRPASAGDQWTRTTADMQWLLAVVHTLESGASGLPRLRVHAHPALTVRGDRVVLSCASTFGAAPAERSRTSVSLRRSEPVALALEAAQDPVTIGELTERLVERFGPPATPRIRALLDSLVSHEVLVSGLRPPLDGGDPLAHVITTLQDAGGDVTVLDGLREVAARIEAYDQVPAGRGGAELDAALRAATRLHEHPTPLHVDTWRDGASTLPGAVAAEIERAMELMWRMSTPKLGLSALRDYHAKFLERYGADRLVPLLDLLDGDVGLGPPAGYSWPNSDAAGPDGPPADRDRDRILFRLWTRALSSHEREVELDDDTVTRLCRGVPDTTDILEVPNSCEVTVHVTAPSARRLADGEFLVTLSPSPGSHHAGSTLARFAGALGRHDTTLRACAAALPTHVSEALPANIAFLPRSGKAANLSHTWPATGRRISVGLSGSPHCAELRLADLAVAATLERLCVVHMPTGREVTPVLANMVSAVAQAPNAARLLWEIGLEGQRLWEPWKWGVLADAPFVPRVRYRRFVLSPAVWRLDELHDISTGPDGEWTAALAGWRARYDVPRHVQVVSNDQRLRLDLDRPWHAALLREELRKDPGLVVHELPGEQQGWLGSDIAGHLTEIVVPLQRRDPTSPRAATPAYAESRRTVHGLGGEWLYLKLYGSAAGQDELLRTHVPALVDAAREHGADRWFFLRYTDPDGHHLRLRLHGDPAELWACAAGELGRILRSWQDCGLLREHRLDQYDPEFERYGGAGLAGEVERLFAADSAAAIELLNLAADPACPYDLDTLVAASVAALAHAFGPPSSAAGSGSCAGEAALEPAEAWLSRTGSRRDLPKRFRKDPGYFARLLDPAGGWPGLHGEVFGEKVLATLHSRDEQVVATRARMDSLRARHACHTEEGRFVGSLMHMTCNRLLGGDSARERDAVAVARGAVQDGAKRRRHGQ